MAKTSGCEGATSADVRVPEIEAHATPLLDVPCELQHRVFELGEMRFVVGAHVQAQRHLAGHLGQRVLLRVRVEAADGEGHRPARRVALLPDLVEAEGELAGRQHGVVPEPPGKTDVRVFALDLHLRIAEVAGNARSDRNRNAGLDQLRRLLDVQLDERLDGFGLEAGLARTHVVDVRAAFRHVLFEGAAGVDTPGAERARRQNPEGRTAANVGDLEPHALFGPECHGRDVAVRPQSEPLQAPDGDQARR